jgi:hypothetical protein
MQLKPDLPIGVPPFALSDDEIDTVVDLICQGVREARAEVTSGLLEVPITIIVRKAMRRMKKVFGLTNLEVRGEHELDDMATNDASLLGRIDITLKFLRQFGDEDDYIAVECKRVGAGTAYSRLNVRYVSEGVVRFVNGQYATGHAWGFMLGYVLALPAEEVVRSIDHRLRKTYGESAKLISAADHPDALSIHDGALAQHSGSAIRLRHILVDMTPAS